MRNYKIVLSWTLKEITLIRRDFSNFAVELIILNSSFFKVFSGNNDRYTPVSNDLKYPIITPYIRIHPELWHGRIAMRTEFYGCIEGEN